MSWSLKGSSQGGWDAFQDNGGLPTSISMDPDVRLETAKPIEWVDDLEPTHNTQTKLLSPTQSTVSTNASRPEQALVASGVRAWTKSQAYGASDALLKYATGSPLLPQQIAELVTNLGAIARVSLKAAAFFIEVILESVRDGTGAGLGITRRALIAAVGTAQAVHSYTVGRDWQLHDAGPLNAANRAFVSVLDRYTAVGVYLIHHTLTLTELFAMSGFQIVGDTVAAGFMAADESVRTIDGLFGSNETSRALAAFITLVRGLFQDPRYNGISTVSVLTRLTKALTAFAVLQNSTYKRSAKSMKMKVIYDCTVLGQVEAKSWRSLIVGSGNFVRNALPASLDQMLPPQQASEQSPYSSSPARPRMRQLSSSASGIHIGDGLCLTDVEPISSYQNFPGEPTSPLSPRREIAWPDNASIMEDLSFLVGAEDDNGLTDESSASLTSDQLPNSLRRKLQGYSDDQLRNGVIIEQQPNLDQAKRLRHVVKRDQGRTNRETVYEITTEVIETIETVTTMEEQNPSDTAANAVTVLGSDGVPDSPRRRRGSSITHRDVKTHKSGIETHSVFEGGREVKLQEDEEWCEVRTTRASQEHHDRRRGSIGAISSILSSPHLDSAEDASAKGFPAVGPIASKEGQDGSSKLPVVFKTITKKLVQKRKTIRRIELHENLDPEIDALDPKAWTAGSTSPTMGPAASKSLPLTPEPARGSRGAVSASTSAMSAATAEMGRGLQKALKRAKESIRSSLHSDDHAPQTEKHLLHSQTSIRNIDGSTKAGAFSPSLDRQNSTTSVSASREWRGRTEAQDRTTASKTLPSIPPRTNSHLSQSHAGTPFGRTLSSRDTPSRSRALSITSMRSFASKYHLQSSAAGDMERGKHGRDPASFPQAHLVENLRRFVRYSTAAYGQNFMRILGIGSLDYLFPDTSTHHANVWAFARHVGIPVDRILLNSFSETQPIFSEKMSPLVNYVAVDDAAKAVVLTCRGTMGLSDILTDLTCEFEDIIVEGGRIDHRYQVHSGMLASSRRLCDEKSIVMQTIRLALEDNPDYGLVITGHSLGGGVAVLAAVELSCPAPLFRRQVLQRQADDRDFVKHPAIFTPFVTSLDSGLPPGRPIHAYAYGVPAVASPDLSKHCQGLVTSVVHGHDFIPTLSLGMVHDFQNVAHTLSEHTDTDIAKEIVSKVVAVNKKRNESRKAQSRIPSHMSVLEAPRPQEAPLSEREMKLSKQELLNGKTRNLAQDSGYQDPSLLEDEMDPFSYSSGGGHSFSRLDLNTEDAELSDWLWSLIKTMRAGMDSPKLYPPGDVYCIESFPVFVTEYVQSDSNTTDVEPDENVKRDQAHRVILRYCEDVEKRFSEPIFAKSMLRDHIPTNYELCTSLLYESMVDTPDDSVFR